MATGESIDRPPFDWGDPVRIIDLDLATKCGYDVGSVCGFRVVDDESIAREFGVRLGSSLVLVEFPDGTSLELPADKLKHLPE